MGCSLSRSSSNFTEFANVRTALCSLIDEISQRPAAETLAVVHEGTSGLSVKDILAELHSTITDDRFRVAVLGEFSCGKSSLLNVLLDRIDLEGKRTDGFLPTAISPTTPVLTSLVQSEEPYVRLTMDDASTVEADLDELKAYLCTPELRAKWSWQSEDEKKNELCNHISEVQIGLDSPLLQHGVELLDTPGLGSIYARHGEITKRCVAGVDAALFLVATDPPMGEREMTFLQYISGYTDRLMFVQTKSDLKEEEENGEPISSVRLRNYRSRISEVLGDGSHEILPVSAVLAARAARTNDDSLNLDSGFPKLKCALEQLLVTVRGAERTAVWTRRISLMVEIMSANLRSELLQVRSHLESIEMTVTSEGEYLQWEAAVPLFQGHMRDLRTRARGQINDAQSRALRAVKVEVMPFLTGASAEALATNPDKRLKLERQLVEAVQRQTTQVLDPLVTDVCSDAQLAASQTLGEAIPKSFQVLQGSVDLGLLIENGKINLSLSELVTTTSETRTRRPEGFWESVQGFFGKKFEERVTKHRLNKEYFDALVESAVQASIQDVTVKLDTHLKEVSTAIVEEMKRLERAARDRDSRAEKIRVQSLEEVGSRASAISAELAELDLVRAKLEAIVQ